MHGRGPGEINKNFRILKMHICEDWIRSIYSKLEREASSSPKKDFPEFSFLN
jgi:hypothetical protein